jgi:hypothetical protein
MVYLAKKDGQVIAHTDPGAMKDLDGVSIPDMTVTEAEWYVAGGIARIIDGGIFLGGPKRRNRWNGRRTN